MFKFVRYGEIKPKPKCRFCGKKAHYEIEASGNKEIFVCEVHVGNYQKYDVKRKLEGEK